MKTIKIDDETYHILEVKSMQTDVSIAGVAKYLIEKGCKVQQLEQENAELRKQLSHIDRELRRIADECYGEGFSKDDDLEGVLGAIENMNYMLDAHIDHERELERRLQEYQTMFSCCICGKPMDWSPNDNLGQALKAFVKEKRWGHGACIDQRKQ